MADNFDADFTDEQIEYLWPEAVVLLVKAIADSLRRDLEQQPVELQTGEGYAIMIPVPQMEEVA